MKNFFYIISRFLSIYIGRLVYVINRPKIQSINTPKSVLLIRWDRIGDAVVTLPIIRMLKVEFPEICIDVVASEFNRFVFDKNSDINTLIVLKGVGRGYGVLDRLKALIISRFSKLDDLEIDKKYDLCIDMTNGERTFIFKDFARYFVGPKSDDGISSMYDFYPKQSLIDSGITYVQYYQYFFRDFFGGQFDYLAAYPPVQRCTIPPFSSKRKIIIIYIGGSQDYRRLSIESMQEVISELAIQYNLYVFDDPDSSRLNTIELPSKYVTVLTGYSLQELSYISRSCVFYIGAEGGVSHYLSSHIKSLVIFSPKYYFQHYKIWLPFDGDHYTVYSESKYEKTLISLGSMGHMAILIKPKKVYPIPPYVSEEMMVVPSFVFIKAIKILTSKEINGN